MMWASMSLVVALFAGPVGTEQAKFRVVWKARCEFLQGIRLPLAANDQHVFFDETYLVQQNIRTGKRRRRISKGDCDGPVLDIRFTEGRVLFLCEHPRSEEEMVHPAPGPDVPLATLRAVHLGSGKLAWEHDGAIPEPVAVSEERVYLVSDQTLLALDARRGETLWKAPDLGVVPGGPAADERFVFTQNESGLVRAHSAETGEKFWQRKLEGKPRAPFTVGVNSLFVPRLLEKRGKVYASRLYALEKDTGRMVWKRSLSGEVAFFAGATWKELLLLPAMGDDGPGHLYAWSQINGEERWKQEVNPDANGHDFTPVVWNDQILIWSGCPGRYECYHLLNLDARTGRTNWFYRPPPLEKPMLSIPIVRSGLLLFGDGEWVRALRRIKRSPPPLAE
jgi:outer membrane protein assembly factor BamB